MKTSLLILSLVSLSLTGFSATAASPTEESDPAGQLPAFEVKVDRLSPQEQAVKRQLESIRAEANKPIVVKIDLPRLKLQPADMPKVTTVPTSPVVVAGL